ncbi:MAG TPA: SAM hydroxide adenosyltransferase [Patescibacteria group bacterium]|uniref:S-adenosyl-l-methionine hydroxide adenosyltransferase C-terminal domain-containing protein n=1 Tax=Candidatus Buchananbacteria bacterium RIFCSPLOWO2_01_FULL_40_23b TaxID=1797544 RepID=A0A1G1YLV6_9BACT|nr:MAG: hypothetical protein A2912_04055 [Candidatus Buchananbacteria bacterium RIFCSPLOWO2_01_FULL_40_23b]HLB60922.1 SAM hydroxide adenosyltransferase [Patescibacteria group bacterium]
MFVSIITDCCDDNALNRQAVRYMSYLNAPISKIGLTFYASEGNGELEGAGNLIDTLDATEGKKGLVVLNTAHRDGKGKKWPNGTPFGYFHYKDTLVISTIDGYCLSLVKKMKLTKKINLLDVPTVIDTMIKQDNFLKEYRKLVVDSQFRSYEFVPRVAKWLMNGVELPHEKYAIEKIADAPQAIWWVDNFGNSVTTVMPEDIGLKPGKKIKTKFGTLTCYDRLKDVPNNEGALIIGSWGIDNRRWVSLVIQGKSAAKEYGIKTGMELF